MNLRLSVITLQRLVVVACLLWTVKGSASAETLDEVWRNPPPEARVRAYWWWLNSNVDREAISRDLEQMKAKGFGGAVLFDAGGAEQRGNDPVPAGPTFASPEWCGLFRHTLAEGDRLGLELSLNIQSGWNLGGPSVSIDDAVKKLVTTEAVVEGPGAIDVILPAPKTEGGYYRDVMVIAYPIREGQKASGGVTDWRQKTLEEKLKFDGPDAFFRTNSAPRTDGLVADEADRPGEEDARSAEVIDLTADLSRDGHLRWTAPAGRWQVLRLGCTLGDVHEVSTHSAGWAGYAIDVFDRGAFERYTKAVVVPLLEQAKGHPSLRYLHTDSWEVDLINWTPTLRDEFKRRRGYDPLPFMAAFAGRIVDRRTTTNRFLNDYRKTLGDLAIDNHYRPLRDLAHHYGLGLHPESGGPHYTPIDAQRSLGINDVPMSEFWAQSAQHRVTEEARFFVKQPASAAHTYGHPIVAAEGFTSIGPHWQETLWDNLKPSFDHAIAEGLNRLVWHAFVCSPESMGLPGQQYFAGTHFNPNVTWWAYAEPFLTYLNRCQALMQRGAFVADVLYYYGDHVPNFTQLRASDPARVGAGFDYDVISEEALLERLSVAHGRLVLPDGMQYRMLVLPNQRSISLPVLRKVRELVAEGATIVGPRPERASSLTGQPTADQEVADIAAALWNPPRAGASSAAKTGRVFADRAARDILLADDVGPDVAFDQPTGTLDWIHRREGTTDIYFVANRRANAIAFRAGFRVSNQVPELWDAVTGEQRYASAYLIERSVTTLPLELPAYGSTFVIFRAPTAEHPATGTTNAKRFTNVAELAGPWTVSFDPKWGGPVQTTFATLTSWTTSDDPGVRFYSGTATYRKTFELTATQASTPLWLDLGMVRELAAVRMNGFSVGVVWAPPFCLNLGESVRPGPNQLEIDVVNFWPNRIIGDASRPPNQRLTRTNITQLRPTTALMPSGLLGPVKLRSSLESR